MTDDTDRVLDGYWVVLAQGGSRAAFDRLAQRWTPRLLRYAARMTGRADMARDIVQESWIGAIRGLKGLTDPAQFPAWIYSIARRRCIDAIRVNQRQRRLLVSAQADSDTAATLGSGGDAANEGVDLAAAISRLNEEQREVVQLLYGEDLGVEEISRVLAVPVGTVKSRLFHARQSLKKHLGE